MEDDINFRLLIFCSEMLQYSANSATDICVELFGLPVREMHVLIFYCFVNDPLFLNTFLIFVLSINESWFWTFLYQ